MPTTTSTFKVTHLRNRTRISTGEQVPNVSSNFRADLDRESQINLLAADRAKVRYETSLEDWNRTCASQESHAFFLRSLVSESYRQNKEKVTIVLNALSASHEIILRGKTESASAVASLEEEKKLELTRAMRSLSKTFEDQREECRRACLERFASLEKPCKAHSSSDSDAEQQQHCSGETKNAYAFSTSSCRSCFAPHRHHDDDDEMSYGLSHDTATVTTARTATTASNSQQGALPYKTFSQVTTDYFIDDAHVSGAVSQCTYNSSGCEGAASDGVHREGGSGSNYNKQAIFSGFGLLFDGGEEEPLASDIFNDASSGGTNSSDGGNAVNSPTLAANRSALATRSPWNSFPDEKTSPRWDETRTSEPDVKAVLQGIDEDFSARKKSAIATQCALIEANFEQKLAIQRERRSTYLDREKVVLGRMDLVRGAWREFCALLANCRERAIDVGDLTTGDVYPIVLGDFRQRQLFSRSWTALVGDEDCK